jgi:transcriptional regulator with XRE-family HTH domain
MRSKVFQGILDNAKSEDRIFVRKYADMVVHINSILRHKNWTQKHLSEKLGKKPSEINKWLKGEHNFTLRSISKLEAELGEEILIVPQKITPQNQNDIGFQKIKEQSLSKDKKIEELEQQILILQRTIALLQKEKTT